MVKMKLETLIRYLQENARKRDILRLKTARGHKKAKRELIDYFDGLQLPSGAFPYIFQKQNPGSFMDTYRTYQILKEVRDGDITASIIEKIVQFLEKSQQKDGSWNENEKLLELASLPSWMDPRKEEVKILTTTYSVLIMVVEHPSSPHTLKGLGYLQKQQGNEGTFPGFPHTTWIAGAVFLGYYGVSHSVSKEMVGIINELIDQDHPGSILQWIASSLILVGYTSHSLTILSRTLDKLEKAQQANGLWIAEDQEIELETTINCLITLDMGGRIDLKSIE
jgi:prenyltransferase beta subunit